MPTCIFILSRFTLRVDNVLFRARDTRVYHSFGSTPPVVVCETRGWEAPYERVKRVTALSFFFSFSYFFLFNLLCAHLRRTITPARSGDALFFVLSILVFHFRF
jgi:hypothetical protein